MMEALQTNRIPPKLSIISKEQENLIAFNNHIPLLFLLSFIIKIRHN